MKTKIENPRVFISYAWADEEYQNLVLAFASQLVRDGIDVVFDKWDLSEGNDTFAFMEKCVTDSTITNVLMLLDPVYAKKADEHSGGVGTETQIISAKVYQEVTQDKFIPIVMKRDEEGQVCKPTYLQGRLHFDLSLPENYDETYQRLVKKLYGEQIYAKPDLGNKPAWVEKPVAIAPKTVIAYETLKETQPSKVKTKSFSGFLSEISRSLIEYANKSIISDSSQKDYIALYDETAEHRTKYLQLLKNSVYVDNCSQCIAVFFEETMNSLPSNESSVFVKIRIHELFIYTIAFFLKEKDYDSVGYLLGKTYFNRNQMTNKYGADCYKMFYSGQDHQMLDQAIRARDNKRYNTGTGKHWIETLAVEYCSLEQFLLGDLICYNYAVYGMNYNHPWAWFPITYIYDDQYHSVLEPIGKKMVSREYVQSLLPLFGYNTIEELKTKMLSVEQGGKSTRREIRYPEVFESAALLSDFVNASDVGSLQ